MTARLPRRLVLRGLGGVAIALPLLEFTQGRAYGQSAAPPKRFITFFEHGGTLSNCTAGAYGFEGFSDGKDTAQGMDGWRPTSTPGQPLVLGRIHEPLTSRGNAQLKDLTSKCVVVRGIDNNAAMEQGDYGSGHQVSNTSILTANKCKEPGQANDACIGYAPSIDQIVGSRWGAPPGGFATVNLVIDAHNYGTPYFKGPKQEASRYGNPTQAFNTLLAGVQSSTGGPDPAVVRARRMRRSILDGTDVGLSQYRGKLSSRDVATVDAHLTHIRSIETRLEQLDTVRTAACTKPNIPTVSGDYNQVERFSPLMVDIAIAALKCGVTNVLSLEIGDFHMTWDPTPLPFDVGYDIGHSLHHMSGDLGERNTIYQQHPDWRTPWQEAMVRNRQFRTGLVAKLLRELDVDEGNGTTLLDNSLLLWTSEFSNAGFHSGADMPFLLAGKAGGRLQTGRYLNYNTAAANNDFTRQYSTRSTTNNLYISVMNLLGFNDTTFGDMKYARVAGPLPGL